jgi:hypothetical protein
MTIAALRAIQNEGRLTTAQLLKEVEFLLSSCTPAAIALRLGTTMEAIEQNCRRHGRPEMAVPFNTAIMRQRLEACLIQEAHQGHVDLWE